MRRETNKGYLRRGRRRKCEERINNGESEREY